MYLQIAISILIFRQACETSKCLLLGKNNNPKSQERHDWCNSWVEFWIPLVAGCIPECSEAGGDLSESVCKIAGDGEDTGGQWHGGGHLHLHDVHSLGVWASLLCQE